MTGEEEVLVVEKSRPEERVEALVAWLAGEIKAAGAKGAVFGLSGGIDAAVTGALCKRACGDETLGLILPCFSSPEDVEDAKLVAETLDLSYRVIDLDDIYLLTAGRLSGEKVKGDEREPAFYNIKPRLRMIALYHWAARLNYLVVGTSNRSERMIGYFTKHGDGGVDLMPLGNLVKTEVRALASSLGIPEKIINKPPSAGLWAGQTDEGELGLTYADLDRYLLTGEGSPEVRKRLREMEEKTAHKRRMPPLPEI
ncbi:MAG: NAD(+) synthase [Clostridia bacterium]|nr:NAD(+) synthase [Clostridia bacterium]